MRAMLLSPTGVHVVEIHEVRLSLTIASSRAPRTTMLSVTRTQPMADLYVLISSNNELPVYELQGTYCT